MWRFIVLILIGLIAGWLAEKIMKVDMPTWQNLLLGLCGSALGSLVLGLIGRESPSGFIGGIVVALIFACLIIWCVNFIKAKTKKG